MASLKKTKNANVSGVKIKNFPVILRKDYAVDYLILNYCFELYRYSSISSIYTYATHLCDFVSQLEVEDDVNINTINDAWLSSYKNAIRNRHNSSGNQNTENYATQVLSTVIRYLTWLEDNNYIRNVIGIGKLYRVRLDSINNKTRHPLSRANTKQKRKNITPRSEWIEAIKQHGPKRDDLAERFSLMIDWGKTLGLRAMEMCALKVNQLPLRETAENALKENRNTFILLSKTKGNKPANIPVSPELIINTWDFIDIYRTDIVSRYKKRAKKDYKPYFEPEEIFLSDKSGVGITPRGLSNSMRSAFLRAVECGDLTVDERVWTHGLRHNFTNNLLKALDRAGVKRPEAVARQITRHGSVEAMEPYLVDRFNEDFHG